MSYKYDIHVHTAEGSPCAKDSARDIVRAYAKAGFTGFVVTDHFNGYMTRRLYPSYRACVENQWNAFLIAQDEAKKCGIDVFFGIEYGYGYSDFLTYGIDVDFLLKNEDLCEIDFEEYAKRVHEAGGFICQAHPFRYSKVAKEVYIPASVIDAIEIYNGSHIEGSAYLPEYNDLAKHYAEVMGFPQTCGSDTHSVNKETGYPIASAAMYFDEKIKDLNHMAEMIKEKRCSVSKV